MNAPIALFAYNRPEHLMRTLAALAANPRAAESEIYLFSDGPKGAADAERVAMVRRILRAVTGFRNIELIVKEQNQGLASSIIAGVGMVLAAHETVIVLEDDIEVAPRFLDYMNGALEFYRDDPRIFSISGYTLPITLPERYPHDIFLLPRASSWGWATWRDRWAQVDWEVCDRGLLRDSGVRDEFDNGGSDLSDMLEKQLAGKIDSWAIRFNWAHFRHDGYSIVPVVSQTRNNGCDGTGRHVGRTRRYEGRLDDGKEPVRFVHGLLPNDDILEAACRFFNKSMRRHIKHFLRRIMKT